MNTELNTELNTPTPTPHTDALAALTAERDQLRLDCENETKWAAHYLAESLAAKARAEKAEAALATERARLRQVALDACKSAQIRPLVWYPKGYFVNPNDLGKINEQQVEACVAALDAAMKEDVK